MLHGLELLIRGSGTGNGNWVTGKKTNSIKNSNNADLLKICMKYFCHSIFNHVKPQDSIKRTY